jgi:hypothetical protein
MPFSHLNFRPCLLMIFIRVNETIFMWSLLSRTASRLPNNANSALDEGLILL